MIGSAIELPHCQACDRPHWPAREICPFCLGDTVVWRQVAGAGSVLAATILHHSLSPAFRPQLPMTIVAVGLDCGVRVIAHLDGDVLATGTRVCLTANRSGFVASAEQAGSC